MVTYDRLTRESKGSCLKLSDNLVFSPQNYKAEMLFHIEDRSSTRFFRIGLEEYTFVSLFDGRTSFAQALAITAQKLGPSALTEKQATEVVTWLLDNNLASYADEKNVRSDSEKQAKNVTLLQKLNPFWLKIPCGNPATVFSWLLPHVQWCFHPATFLLSMLLMFVAAFSVAANWSSFCISSAAVFSGSNWFWMLVVWVVLKIVHETAHGVVCFRYGGRVKEAGIIFILFAPMAYVDVTSSWRFSSRWRRIAVASAGMYVELLLASVCAIAWHFTNSPFIAHLLFNVIVMASLSTLIFNANPLMRFDGYFILSDLFQIPNLYNSGSKSFGNSLNWLFFGQVAEKSCCELRQHSKFVFVYGILAAFWKLLICLALSIAASVMFGGLGILISAFGIFSWFAKPAMQLVKDVFQRKNSRPHTLVRAAMVMAGIVLVATSSWYLVPNPFSERSPCLVDYHEASKVRADSAGFVQEVFVAPGQTVEKDQPLFRLVNHELAAEVAGLRAEHNLRLTRERISVDRHEPGQSQIAKKNQQALKRRLDEQQAKLERLVVRARTAGRVVARNLPELVGTYVDEGQVLMLIGNDELKEIVLSLDSENADTANSLVGRTIPVEIGSRRRIFATISRIDPKASLRVNHPSLAATNGGDLVVRYVDEDSSTEGQQIELCEPRFEAIATIDPETARQLFSGERGSAIVDSNATTLGAWVTQAVSQWLKRQFREANGSS